jgi:transporter family-2 protein
MTQAFYIFIAIAIGAGAAAQVGIIGQLGRLRGPTEASWISAIGTVTGIAAVFAIQSLRNEAPNLPSPFNTVAPFAAIAVLLAAALTIAVRGMDSYMATAGLFGLAYLFGAGFLVPKIGVALFLGATTAGTLIAALGLDHIGAFGGAVQRISVVRVVGAVALLTGVVLIRSGR